MLTTALIALALTLSTAIGYTCGRIQPWVRFGAWIYDLRFYRQERWVGRVWRERAVWGGVLLTDPREGLTLLADVRRLRRERRKAERA